jgi:general stress protein CsbA
MLMLIVILIAAAYFLGYFIGHWEERRWWESHL